MSDEFTERRQAKKTRNFAEALVDAMKAGDDLLAAAMDLDPDEAFLDAAKTFGDAMAHLYDLLEKETE